MNENEKNLANERQSEQYIKLVRDIFKYWKFVVATVLVIASLLTVYARITHVPLYKSKAIVRVSAGHDPDDVLNDKYKYNNTAAEALALSIPSLVATDMLKDLANQASGKVSILSEITATCLERSNCVIISAEGADAKNAYISLCAVIEVLPQVLNYLAPDTRIVVLETPTAPSDTPTNAFSVKESLLNGGIIGVAVGVILVIFYSMTRKTVTTPNDLKQVANVEIMGAFPKYSNKKRRDSSPDMLKAIKGTAFSESTKELRMKVLRSLKKDQNVIMLTSAIPGEGKTTMSVNLAKSLAEDGRRVLLIDADLHKQDVAFQLYPNRVKAPSVFDYLEGKTDFVKCITRSKELGIDIISGHTSDKRIHSYPSHKIKALFERAKAAYDYVVVDASPYGIVSDAGLICRHADALLFVVRQDYASKTSIIDSINGLNEKGANIIGFIVNGITQDGKKYGYSYGYKYGYGQYGYGYRYGKYGYGTSYGNYGYGYGYGKDNYGLKYGFKGEDDAESNEESNDKKSDNK